MNPDQAQSASSPKSSVQTVLSSVPTLAPAEQQERYWATLKPLLPELSDWELSLLALLVFWSGPKAVPGDLIYKSWASIGPKLGSKRSGAGAADRQVMRKAAAQLVKLGLVERNGLDAGWRVVPRVDLQPSPEWPTALRDRVWLRANSLQPVPEWPAFAKFNARLWRRDFYGPMSARAGICRLSFDLDAEGRWEGTTDHLGALLGVKSAMTTKRRQIELSAAESDLDIQSRWDAGQETFSISCSFELPPSAEDLDAELLKARDALWYPEIVEEAIARAGRLLKSGTVSKSRQLKGFFQPVLALQTEYKNPALIKYALEETISNGVLDGARGKKATTNWHRYTRTVANNNRHRFRKANDGLEVIIGPVGEGSEQPGVKKITIPEPTIRERELAMRAILREAAQLNGIGSYVEARRVLTEAIKPEIPNLAPLFDGDLKRCKYQLALAFKQGSTDFVGVKLDEYALDYWPEWTPAA